MNSVNFKIVKLFIKNSIRISFADLVKGVLFFLFFFIQVRVKAEIQEEVSLPKTSPKIVVPTNAVFVKPTETSLKQKDEEIREAIRKAVQPIEPAKEIVILNTEAGFVPDKVRVKRGVAYKVHIVNLNMKEKNVSFIMDSFTQSHNTVFGLMRSFNIEPQIEGVYSYQCPETGIQGQLVVVGDADLDRKPASKITRDTVSEAE